MKKLHLAILGLMVCGTASVYGAPNSPSIPPLSVQLDKTISLSGNVTIQQHFTAGSATATGAAANGFSAQSQTSNSRVATPPVWPSP